MVVCLSILALRKSDDLSKVYPASSLIVAGIGSSPPATLKRIRGRELMDGWMVLKICSIKKEQKLIELLLLKHIITHPLKRCSVLLPFMLDSVLC